MSDLKLISVLAAAGVAALLLCVPHALAAQATAGDDSISYPNVRVTGRVHFQAYALGNDAYAADVGPGSTGFARRVRIEARGHITPRISYIVMPSYEQGQSGSVRLLDTWIDVRLTDPGSPNGLVWRVGNEKRPIGRYELSTSNNLPSLERHSGRGQPRLSANDLFLGNNFLAWDIGTSLIWNGAGRYTLQAGVYNGAGEVDADENDSKAFGARGTVALTRRLNVGASYFSADGIVGSDSSFRHSASEIDLQWGRPGAPGLYLLGDFMQGTARLPTRDRLRGLTLVGAYHFRLAGARNWLYALEPAMMFDIGDPDTRVADNHALLVRAVAGAYFAPTAHVRLAYERQSFADGRPAVQGVRTQLSVSW